MKIDLKKIAGAFLTKLNPTEHEKEWALKRLEVCSSCPYKSTDISKSTVRCLSCGCFIHGKVFSTVPHECPEGKWNDIDDHYYNKKTEKTLI